MQGGQLLGALVTQLGPEQLGEQRVVAVPVPAGAAGHGEDVLPLQPGQDLGAVGAAGQRVGQAPQMRSGTEVRSRNARSSGGWTASTSSSR